MIYLDVQELLHTAERVLGTVEMRDMGLLESAAARPQAAAFGEDAYATLHEKTAALIHSIARNHALVDGNKRLALAAGIAYFGMNGCEFTATEDEAYDLIIAIASGELDDIGTSADRLRDLTHQVPGPTA